MNLINVEQPMVMGVGILMESDDQRSRLDDFRNRVVLSMWDMIISYDELIPVMENACKWYRKAKEDSEEIPAIELITKLLKKMSYIARQLEITCELQRSLKIFKGMLPDNLPEVGKYCMLPSRDAIKWLSLKTLSHIMMLKTLSSSTDKIQSVTGQHTGLSELRGMRCVVIAKIYSQERLKECYPLYSLIVNNQLLFETVSSQHIAPYLPSVELPSPDDISRADLTV